MPAEPSGGLTCIVLAFAADDPMGPFMRAHSPKEITELLVAWGDGDQAALDELTPLVHEELHRLAHHYMGGERTGHTLQTTALVNEAYIRLIDWKNVRWQSRAHFFGVSAQLMRRILVDFARSKGYRKRGGGAPGVSLDEAAFVSDEKGDDLVALDEALWSLAKLDERQSKVVELRFFGGLSVEETAEVLKVSSGTVRRDWSLARAWLHRELAGNREA
ncbi:MAG: sigma-70 family RNA polymerase sigma factor [Pyrinomonadaceae bacterium]